MTARWNCETCAIRANCMQAVLKRQKFSRAECNYSAPRTHQTPAQTAVADFLETHHRFSRLDMRAAGLTEQQVVYHLRRAEESGAVKLVAKRHGAHPAIYEVCGEY